MPPVIAISPARMARSLTPLCGCGINNFRGPDSCDRNQAWGFLWRASCRLSSDANGAISMLMERNHVVIISDGWHERMHRRISDSIRQFLDICKFRYDIKQRLQNFFWSPLQLYGEQLIEETLIYAFRPLYVKVEGKIRIRARANAKHIIVKYKRTLFKYWCIARSCALLALSFIPFHVNHLRIRCSLCGSTR